MRCSRWRHAGAARPASALKSVSAARLRSLKRPDQRPSSLFRVHRSCHGELAGQTDDVLWLSPVAKLGTGKAVRGGIPVCWPWFGPHPSGTSLPAHGFVRAAAWRVTGSAASASRARLVLAFDTAVVAASMWPSRAQAEIEITLSDTLTLRSPRITWVRSPLS